MFVKALRIGVS